jgi:hypothetical protein
MKKKSYRNQLGLLKQKKQMYLILIFLFVMVIIWTVISLLSSQEKLQISKELKDMTIPLNPSVDLEIFDKLDQKRKFTESELQGFAIYKIITSDRGRDARVVKIDYEEETVEQPAVQSESLLQGLEGGESATGGAAATGSAGLEPIATGAAETEI